MEKRIKNKVQVVFVIPFFDNDINQLLDTIDSIKHYIKEPYSIVCINDCKKNERVESLKQIFEYESVYNFVPHYETDRIPNAYGSLWCNLYQGMEYSLKVFDFDYLIKMDTDALVTGGELINNLDAYFQQNDSDIGLIGSYKIRADGKRRTRWRWALFLLYLVYIKKNISRESTFWRICLPEARGNGYKLGESMLGGVYIFSYKCIEKITCLFPYKLFQNDKLYIPKIGEDIIFSLLTFACGYRIGDFGRPGDPIAVAQNYLPLTNQEIVRQEKQIIHSVNKGINGEKESEIREYFRRLRGQPNDK